LDRRLSYESYAKTAPFYMLRLCVRLRGAPHTASPYAAGGSKAAAPFPAARFAGSRGAAHLRLKRLSPAVTAAEKGHNK